MSSSRLAPNDHLFPECHRLDSPPTTTWRATFFETGPCDPRHSMGGLCPRTKGGDCRGRRKYRRISPRSTRDYRLPTSSRSRHSGGRGSGRDKSRDRTPTTPTPGRSKDGKVGLENRYNGNEESRRVDKDLNQGSRSRRRH